MIRRKIVYTDLELEPWFAEVEAGFPFNEAAQRANLDWLKLQDTIYQDDEVMDHALKLSMVAGALIRTGQQPVPDRQDKLYEEFKDPANWWEEEP